MSGPDEPTSIQPLPDPAHDEVALLLADVLSTEAARIEPTDRLAEIRTAGASRRPSWGPVAAAVAAVLVVGGGTWALVDRDSTGPRPPAAASPTPTTPPTSASASSPSASPTGTSGTWAAPIYYPGRSASGLYREFHPLPATPGSVATHISDALKVATDPRSPRRVDLEYSPWLVGTSRSLQVAMAGNDTVVVTLPVSETSRRGATREQARLAAQQLVWTATAVAQDARLGLQIRFSGGPGKLFGVLPVDTTFRRPPINQSYLDLAAIWILQPEPGSTVRGPVVLCGQACTFEANVAWQVVSGATVARSGHTTAAQACPVRSSWSVTLKGLPPGSYTFRAFELSPKDGTTYQGLDTTTFTVR
ncbi:MAG: Gmad2 immunoglobulin-like domain-containing protein [Actinomycetales bacterium]